MSHNIIKNVVIYIEQFLQIKYIYMYVSDVLA